MVNFLTHYGSDKVKHGVLSSAYLFWSSSELMLTLTSYLTPLDWSFASHGYIGAVGLLIIGIIFGLYRCRPIRQFDFVDSVSGQQITVKTGDLFDEEGNLVVGMSDCFDTELGDVINQDSIQGQLVNRLYSGDLKKLDKDLRLALRNKSLQPVIDSQKTRGKNKRYPIGTTISLSVGSRKVICCAYSSMGADLVTQVDAGSVWCSLMEIWQSVRTFGGMQPISIPIIGTDRARVHGSPKHQVMAKAILLSYLFCARSGKISNRMTVVVSPADLGKVSMYELRDFLEHA